MTAEHVPEPRTPVGEYWADDGGRAHDPAYLEALVEAEEFMGGPATI